MPDDTARKSTPVKLGLLWNIIFWVENAGEYEVELFFDYSKSSLNATSIHIEGIEFNNAFDLDIDTDVIKYSPIIYGRNIFAWNESNRTDIPLLMYYDISYDNNIKTIYLHNKSMTTTTNRNRRDPPQNKSYYGENWRKWTKIPIISFVGLV